MRAPITLDLHLPNFNYPDVGPEAVFERLVDIATTAEASGFTSISLMDHFHQIPPVGPAENWMFDGSTMLAGLAGRTSTIALGLLVGGVTYRNPALHAKITTTLDIISGGRAFHGIGAGWFEDEHKAYGFAMPSLGTRFEILEEHLQIARAMFTQPRATVAGEHVHVTEAYNNPKPLRGDIPILIGGSGERKTLRLVAQYADGCNLFGDPERARHLLGVLEGHCETVGRDPSEITKTSMATIVIGATHEAAQAKLDWMRSAGVPEERVAAAIAGDPDTVAQRAAAFREVGIEGLTFSMPDAHDLEAVALAGKALAPVFAA
ncbi:LLM class F420-dependent oxidoreductase [Baekduia soli]|uniref:LLM class F420-dependent oxidoreductase n=1 Tax=Baekduia soli TaxID=496014 RepID=A0A5B8U0G7_9ACTN|nr:LLM class F420-dependent oxidoreductase [Baekduia soli]QEC46503.1 LLM class F420-dependent oxidoreductase [Baekduia soli]